ncbi:UBX domain-containing protein [Heracleum sosnowskyi]|uniref:UBX domain-containing protein n=1 Tax=Heracleum sosnowskyi TaxID=360622 RepID=A0AAD8HY98_9APIA|nr:UBX domain-containing protein [Heracleum sosnowskyi]
MDEVKDKFKGFIKKVNKPFSASTSGKFKGQGHVLGGGSSSTPPNPNPYPTRPLPPKRYGSDHQSQINRGKFESNVKNESDRISKLELDTEPKDGFDPYESLVTTGKRNKNGYNLDNVFECPVCGGGFTSEEEVSVHIESCLRNVESDNVFDQGKVDSPSELEVRVGGYVSGKPNEGCVEIVRKLLSNVVKEPENVKFRRIRMGNLKIKEAIADVVGGVELLEFLGFELQEEGGEMWAIMGAPSGDTIAVVKNAIALLTPQSLEDSKSNAPVKVDEPVERKQVDRQTRVFFSVSENIAAKIVFPDSFYKLTAEEIKREADMKRKKIAESQLLVPKSYKEKQVKAARKRYTKAVIRIQFPDGVVLQGVFSPREPTTALYQFVSSALKEPSLEFELLDPVLVKRRVIPLFPPAGKKIITLEDEDLVPAALIKFRPIETDSIVFTGLCNELLEIMEPLIPDSAVPPL